MCKEEQAEQVEITISLGSNTNQEANIKTAIEELKKEFNDIHFTKPIWTEPIGVQSDKYLNCLASFTTQRSLEDLNKVLKRIETSMGDSHENHKQGIVLMDLDVIKYGNKEVKKIAWLET